VRLEDVRENARIAGLSPEGPAVVKTVEWYGDQALNVIYKGADGRLGERTLYREDEARIELVASGRPWTFDGDGHLLRLVSEAWRIRLAWLFDPYLALATSKVDPLPHQISAVYGEMLDRQPLRFLLADDPGAGKTIMAGLLIKELMLRGDVERCLIVSPGSLTEQWQDELDEKFGLPFDILSRDMIEASRSGNPFAERNLLIVRLDQLSRNEELQERLKAGGEYDLVIVDEAHKMAAHYYGNEVQYTRRYSLGQTLSGVGRHFLLMTATPHNGNEEDFQLFLALLDGDRFEGKYRSGVHVNDPSDIMRRLVKEDLVTFDGKPLFPERIAQTLEYQLSALEMQLYAAVTDYVREEMNRVERFTEQDERRRVNVGFALMALQRRLASSPEAILRSLVRRREKLEARLREERLLAAGRSARLSKERDVRGLSRDELDDLDDLPQEEADEAEERVVDNATAAETIEQLEMEIGTLRILEELAVRLRRSGEDSKWVQLQAILKDPAMFHGDGSRRKLLIFTESRDTLNYLVDRVTNHIGRAEAVVAIHGGVTREDRRNIVHSFMNDPDVVVLVANDAAGEGVNLQRAHLMVNYDLPWNPNRLEQRFGRIHRIGQKEVCRLWNLVAADTREGEVYLRLLRKLEVERTALGGKVFDVLGELFTDRPLRDLLKDAVVYGEDPAVRARLDKEVDGATDRTHIQSLLARRSLVQDTLTATEIDAIREAMQRAEAQRLQPHYIQSFFLDAFPRLGGAVRKRETGRFEITRVPSSVRLRDRQVGRGAAVAQRYERVCFDKAHTSTPTRAEFVCPGHPLLDSTIDLVYERHADLLKQGAMLVDESDPGTEPRLLFYLEHSVHDGRRGRDGNFTVVSQRLLFVEVQKDGSIRETGPAPYLDYRPVTEEERAWLRTRLDAGWTEQDWEHRVLGHAIRSLGPAHLSEVSTRRVAALEKMATEVRSRLQREINLWDTRAHALRERESAGQQTRLSAANAAARAERLAERLQSRTAEIEKQKLIMSGPPMVRGGALVIPGGLLRASGVTADDGGGWTAADDEAAQALGLGRERVEQLAMAAAMQAERALGRVPRDVSDLRGIGYDIESRDPGTGDLYFIEVKGRAVGSDQVTLTRTEMLCALNKPDHFRLVLVIIDREGPKPPMYVRRYDYGQPGFEQTHGTFPVTGLLRKSEGPC
jgi:superfamily II DNA or RNA helicase